MSKETINPNKVEFYNQRGEWTPTNLIPLRKSLPPDIFINDYGLDLYDRTMYVFGNSEVKQIIAIKGLTQSRAALPEIYRNILNEIPNNTWFPHKNAVLRHLKSSFVLTELVQKDGVEYGLTEKNKNISKSVANLLLNYSIKNELPVSVIFGKPSTTSENRSYITRSAILMYLYNQEQSHEIKISRDLNMDLSSVRSGIKILSKNGLIKHEFGGTEKQGENFYRKKGNENMVVHNKKLNVVRQNMVEFFKTNNEANPYMLAESMNRKDISDIYIVLKELVDCGFLERSNWHAGVKQSDTKITEKGTNFAKDVIIPALKICSGNEIEIKKTENINNDSEKLSKILRIFQQTIKEEPKKNKKELVKNYISKNGIIKTKEISQKLGNKNLAILNDMVTSGQLFKYKKGKNTYYTLPDTEIPEIKNERLMVEYKRPEKIIVYEKNPKEFYLKKLESLEFWKELESDLNRLKDIKITENNFWIYFDPENQNWMENDKQSHGKYSRIFLALKDLNIKHPCSYIRSYISKNGELQKNISHIQNLIKNKLIRTKDIKNWQYYLEILNSEEFWLNLDRDINQIDDGTFFSSFMMWFRREKTEIIYPKSKGNYYNLYLAISKHSENPNDYFLKFKPNLDLDDELKKIVLSVQNKIWSKTRFRRESHSADDWVQCFYKESFWKEFDNDLDEYRGQKKSFWTFLYRFDKTNIDLKDHKIGKYYSIINNLYKHIQYFEEKTNIDNIPNKLKTGTSIALRLNFYFKSPIETRDKLLALFPKDFDFAFELLDKSENMSYFMTLPDITDQEQILLTELITQVKEKINYADELVDMERNLKGSSTIIWTGIKAYPILDNNEQKSLVISYEHAKRAKHILELSDGDHPNKFRLQEIISKGEFARECLIKSNQRLVLFFANKYNNSDTNVYDLYQVGNMALINALDSFDRKKGFKFSTFAGEIIKGYMLNSRSSMKGMKIYDYNQLQKILKSKKKIESGSEIPATFKQIAEDTKISVDRVEFLYKRANVRSLEEKVSTNEGEKRELESKIPDKSVNIETQIVRKILNEKIIELLASGIISERQLLIIKLRYGIIDGRCYTYREIGDKLLISFEWVRKLEQEALEKLRNNENIKNIKEDFFS